MMRSGMSAGNASEKCHHWCGGVSAASNILGALGWFESVQLFIGVVSSSPRAGCRDYLKKNRNKNKNGTVILSLKQFHKEAYAYDKKKYTRKFIRAMF